MALDRTTSPGIKKKGDSKVAMSTRSHTTAGSPLNCEVSLSFQDELAATIHGAFEVAVEIAVLEITKLVGQALGDVRDQMHETLRENKTLKMRLQTAEQQLDALRCSLGDESKARLVTATQAQKPHISSKAKAAKSGRLTADKIKVATSKAAADSMDEALREPYSLVAADTESFSEIREDGRVCAHLLDQELRDPVANQVLGDLSATKGNSLSEEPADHVVAVKLDGENTDDAARLNSSSSSSSLFVAMDTCEIKQVKVKEEKSDPGNAPEFESGSDEVAGDKFEPDTLSLVQSRLLEDWRPEPLELDPGCAAERFAPCTSHSLGEPPVSNPEPAAPDSFFPPPFSNPYQPADAAAVPVPQEHYGMQVGSAHQAHVCRICGEAFHLPGELRRHHSQRHSKATARRGRRQAFPPGRSPYRCSQCGRDFNRMENLKTHLRIHTGERPYACTVCGVRFRHSGALTRHFRIHTGEKPYVCSQCGKTFRNCGGLRFHQRSHTREGLGSVN
ncbi:uncharacterized protein [Paramormyrops kingsleyae]|uniref:Zinc finger protein 710-like n=1 Tax=Paramormyrops kingsleyae TaxID=1676925 RepID=A0A3B3S182_9TELE|nr:zinc finger protein 710-like [Paramormyrops kingsleyae]